METNSHILTFKCQYSPSYTFYCNSPWAWIVSLSWWRITGNVLRTCVDLNGEGLTTLIPLWHTDLSSTIRSSLPFPEIMTKSLQWAQFGHFCVMVYAAWVWPLNGIFREDREKQAGESLWECNISFPMVNSSPQTVNTGLTKRLINQHTCEAYSESGHQGKVFGG